MENQQSTDSQQTSQLIQIGYAKFNKISLKNLQKVLSLHQLKPIFKKSNWKIKQKAFKQRWEHAFKQIQESHCIRLDVEAVGASHIINEILNCKFTNLSVINLSHNPILNIESLTYLNAPKLQFIFLQTNHITSAKILSKLYFQNLEQFDLSNNKLKEISSIQRLKTNKQNKPFSIELFTFGQNRHHHHWHEDEQSCKVQNISFMAKLQHSFFGNNLNENKKKYEMIKRQFQYLLVEINSDLKVTSALPQKKQLKALQKKFYW